MVNQRSIIHPKSLFATASLNQNPVLLIQSLRLFTLHPSLKNKDFGMPWKQLEQAALLPQSLNYLTHRRLFDIESPRNIRDMLFMNCVAVY